jgi:hypothetical protein
MRKNYGLLTLPIGRVTNSLRIIARPFLFYSGKIYLIEILLTNGLISSYIVFSRKTA